MIGFFDFETYSEGGFVFDKEKGFFVPIPETTKGSKPGLPTIGVAAYAEHPSTEITCLSYFIGFWGFWAPGLPPPAALFNWIECGHLLEAVNSFFEFNIWEQCAHKRLGWPQLPLEQTRDTAAKALAYGLPRSLKDIGAALDLDVVKDRSGKNLIKTFTMPRKPTKKDPRLRIRIEEEPVKGAQFYEYNYQDVNAEMAASLQIPELSEFETQVWLCDQRINARGVQIDTVALANCLAIVEQANIKYTAELARITGGEVTSHAQLAKMGNWLANHGLVMPDMQKATIDDMLAKLPPHPPGAIDPRRRALEIRADLNSASVLKLKAIKRQLCGDGRLRGLYQYCGASRTGRFAGNGPQPQNMKSKGSSSIAEWDLDAIEAALAVISHRSLESLEVCYGDALATIGGCIRGLFVAAPGCDLICSDFHAIEAVVLAALAGEQWRLDVFRNGVDIYKASASMITGVDVEEIDAKLRKMGKVAELGSGYGGWINAWKNFGADQFYNSDEDIKRDIKAWRKASPNIVELWGDQYREIGEDTWEFTHELYGVEGAMIRALQNPGRNFNVRLLNWYFDASKDVLYCVLPSGRSLAYHAPRLHNTVHRRAKKPSLRITYMGYNSDSQQGPVGWVRKEIWGSKAVENATQAVARDRFVFAMVALEQRGYPIVLHSHDESISEIAEGFGSIFEYELILGANPNWCANWPIKAAGGWRGKRYFKG